MNYFRRMGARYQHFDLTNTRDKERFHSSFCLTGCPPEANEIGPNASGAMVREANGQRWIGGHNWYNHESLSYPADALRFSHRDEFSRLAAQLVNQARDKPLDWPVLARKLVERKGNGTSPAISPETALEWLLEDAYACMIQNPASISPTRDWKDVVRLQPMLTELPDQATGLPPILVMAFRMALAGTDDFPTTGISCLRPEGRTATLVDALISQGTNPLQADRFFLDLRHKDPVEAGNVMTLDMLQIVDQFNRHILVPTLGTLIPAVFKTERESRFEALKRREITSSFQLASTLLLSSNKEQPLLHYAELLRRGMPRLARFNSAIAGYEEEYSQPEKPGLWNDRNFTEPLTGTCQVEGVTFTPIHTRAGLRKEGDRMKHCIGGPGYWREHRAGSRVSYHLDGPGKSQATLSLIFNKNVKILKSGFNAVKNSTPAPTLDIARIRFQEGVNSGQIPIRQEYLKWQQWRLDLAGNERTSLLEDYCHYPVGSMNHTTTDDVQPEVIMTTRLWQEWREVLGRTDLESPLEYLAGEDEARQFIARLAGWNGRQLIDNLDYHFGEDKSMSSRLLSM